MKPATSSQCTDSKTSPEAELFCSDVYPNRVKGIRMPRDEVNHRCGKKWMVRTTLTVTMMVAVGFGSARDSRGLETAPSIQESLSATKKLQSVIEAAWETGPDLVESLSRLDAEAAFDQSFRGVGSPYVQFQMEGIGSGFDPQPNAQRNLRVGTPFDLPWHFSKSRKLGGGLEDWQGSAAEVARLQVAQHVTVAWLRLAAVEEMIGVEERRLNRMDQAVRLQSERFSLGEVAGMEVMQLELQRAQDASILRALQAQQRAMQAAIRQLAGDGVALPALGDLPALADDLPPWSIGWEGEGVEDKVKRGPYFSSLDRRTEKELLLSDLMSATAWGRPEIQVEWEHIPACRRAPILRCVWFQLVRSVAFGKKRWSDKGDGPSGGQSRRRRPRAWSSRVGAEGRGRLGGGGVGNGAARRNRAPFGSLTTNRALVERAVSPRGHYLFGLYRWPRTTGRSHGSTYRGLRGFCAVAVGIGRPIRGPQLFSPSTIQVGGHRGGELMKHVRIGIDCAIDIDSLRRR